jgi:hypothetical protein
MSFLDSPMFNNIIFVQIKSLNAASVSIREFWGQREEREDRGYRNGYLQAWREWSARVDSKVMATSDIQELEAKLKAVEGEAMADPTEPTKERRPPDRKGDIWKAEEMLESSPDYLPPPNNWMVRNSRNGNIAVVHATSDKASNYAAELTQKGYIDDEYLNKIKPAEVIIDLKIRML